METIKINKLEIENVKRVKAVKIEPNSNGLTIIGGNNNQGKTSVLDAIAWALGGNKFKPSEVTNRESMIPANLKIQLNNGLIVERKGKNSDLKVTDINGEKAGQQLLDSFIEELALNLPKFINSNNKEKADILLQIIGVKDELKRLESEEIEIYNKRHTIGQIADQKEKFAKEQPFYVDAPKTLISAAELIKEQQKILIQNGENQKKRDDLNKIKYNLEKVENNILDINIKIQELFDKKAEYEKQKEILNHDIEISKKTVEELQDKSTMDLENNIENIEKINIKVRANLDKEKAEEDAKEYREQYREFTTQLENVRRKKIELLSNANLPLEGLSVEDGELTYNNSKWDNMSGSEQLKVATAIVRKLKPQCGFVLLDKLEQMDIDTLNEFGKWIEKEGLQVIATRVSKGEECSIIIEDGYALKNEHSSPKKWKEGEF